MKKNILLLINGFGIEQQDSYNIYSESLMPNIDKLTKTSLFGSIQNTELDYLEGYRRFSIGINEPLSYSIVNNAINNESYKNNEMINYMISDTNSTNSKLHIIVYWDNDSTLYHLSTYLKEIQTKLRQKIFIHIIFKQKSINEYKNILKSLNVLNYEFGSNIKLGILVGEDNETMAKDFIKSLVTESGEKWTDIDKKVDTLYNSGLKPNQARTFSIGSKFVLNDNDSIFFFNYTNIDVTPLITELINQKWSKMNLNTIKFYSLFPMTCEKVNIPFIFNYAVSATYLLNSLKTIHAKCLVMSKTDKCIAINFYLTGQRGTLDNDIRYMPVDNGFIYNPTTLLNTITSLQQELIIINYEIDDCSSIEDIKSRLSDIDKVIGILYNWTSENNVGLFISSLYGLEKELYNNKKELCKINFSSRVPVIIADKSLPKGSYTFREGNSYDLCNTVLKNISSNFKIDGLLKKKSGLFSAFIKKGD